MRQRWRDELEMLEAMCTEDEFDILDSNSVVVRLRDVEIRASLKDENVRIDVSGGGDRERETVRKILEENQGEVCLIKLVQALSDFVQESDSEESEVSKETEVKIRLRTNPSIVSIRMMNFKCIVHLMSFLHRDAIRWQMTKVSRRFFQVASNGGYRNAILFQERHQYRSVYRMLSSRTNVAFVNLLKDYNDMLAICRGRCVTIGFFLQNVDSEDVTYVVFERLYERLIPIHSSSEFCKNSGWTSRDFISKKRTKSNQFNCATSWRGAAQLLTPAFLRRCALPLLVRCVSEDFHVVDSQEALKVVKDEMKILRVEDHRRDDDFFGVHLQLRSNDVRVPSNFNYMSRVMSLNQRQTICKVHGLIPCTILKDALVFRKLYLLISNPMCNIGNIEYALKLYDASDEIRYDSYALIHALITCKPSKKIQLLIPIAARQQDFTDITPSCKSVDVLLKLGHDPNERMYRELGATPLFLAAETFFFHVKNRGKMILENDLNVMKCLINAGARVEMIVEINRSKRVPAIYHFLNSKEFCRKHLDKELFEEAVKLFFKLLPKKTQWSDMTLEILMSTTLSHFRNSKSKAREVERMAWIVDTLVKIGAKLPSKCPPEFESKFWRALHETLAKGNSSMRMFKKVNSSIDVKLSSGDPLKLREKKKTRVPIDERPVQREHDDFRSSRPPRRRTSGGRIHDRIRRERLRRSAERGNWSAGRF